MEELKEENQANYFKKLKKNSHFVLTWIIPKKFTMLEIQRIKLKSLQNSFKKVRSLKFIPDTCILELEDHSKTLSSVAISPDNEYLATGGDDYEAIIYCINPKIKNKFGKRLFRFSDHGYYVSSVAFSQDGIYFASGGVDKKVILYDFNKASETFGQLLFKLRNHTHHVYSIAFSPDSQYLATGSDDRSCNVFGINPKNSDTYGSLILKLTEHTQPITTVTFNFDGSYFFSGSFDKTVLVYNMNPKIKGLSFGQSIGSFNKYPKEIYKIGFSSDEKFFAIGYATGAVVLLDFNPFNKNFFTELFYFENHNSIVTSLSFSIGNSIFLTGSWDESMINFYDFEKKSRNFIRSERKGKDLSSTLSKINSACFAQNAYLLCIGRVDRKAILYT